MAEVLKYDVQEQIESCLKSSKTRFNLLDTDNIGCVYEVFVSSLPCYIQVEYDLETEEDDCVIIQFFAKVGDGDNYLYHEIWDSTNNSTSIEDEIYELVEANKKFNKVLNKINKNLESIKEICQDHGLEYEDFIQVKYNFE
jgi:hypothetical protein